MGALHAGLMEAGLKSTCCFMAGKSSGMSEFEGHELPCLGSSKAFGDGCTVGKTWSLPKERGCCCTSAESLLDLFDLAS